MRVFIAVNQVGEVTERQTTALLAAALLRKGVAVYLANVEDFSCGGRAQGMWVLATRILGNSGTSSSDVAATVKSPGAFQNETVTSGDWILIRTNPGRDLARSGIHQSFLQLCRVAKSRGVRVVNDPTHLTYFASKGCLAQLDARFCPAMLVSNQTRLIVDFVRSADCDCVLKPLVGSRGQNVLRVASGQIGLEDLIEKTFGGESIVAQHFVSAEHLGDKRVVVCGGKILAMGKWLGGIERRPAEGDFRANLHAGASPHLLTLTADAKAAAEYAAELLNAHGIWLAGVDLIGDRIIEFNVFSTGGLYFAEQFSGEGFSAEIIERLMVVPA